jgi:hypothetical protein
MLGTLGNNKTPVKQNSWLDDLRTTAPQPLFTSPIDGPAGMRFYAYPVSARKPGITDKPASAPPSKGGVDQCVPTQIDVQRVLNNISPIPRSDAIEWKRATDFIEREKEDTTGTPALAGEARGLSPLIRGSVLHRCLEEYTKNGAYDIDGITAEYPEIMTLGHEAHHKLKLSIESILSSVLGNNAFAWIFERHQHAYSELPFLYKKDHSLVSGIVDRVVVKDGKGFVVDYKSIVIDTNEALDDWQEHYRPQLAIYCEAVKEIFKLESVEGYLLFLDSNRLVRCTVL